MKHIKKLYLGILYDLKIGGKGTPGAIVGLSGDALKLQAIVMYDIDNEDVSGQLSMRARF